MNATNNFIPAALAKGVDVKDSINKYGNCLKEDINLKIQEIEAENIKLNAEIVKRKNFTQILEALFNQTVTGVAILDSNYNYIQVNDVYAKWAYRNAADFPGHNHFELYLCEKTKEIFDNVVRTKQVGTVAAKPFTFPDNHERGITYWDWTLTPVLDASGEVDLLIWSSRNVTEHIEDKERLYDSEERYRSIFENSLDGILLATCEGTVISANPSVCRMLGRSEMELCAVGRKGIVDLDDPGLTKAIAEREATGSFSSELTLVHKEGTKFPAEVTSKLFKDREGKALTSMIIRDISERKKSEAVLRFSEEKFSQTFYNNQAMMAIVKISDSTFIDINNAALNTFGFTSEEVIGKSLFELNLWVEIEEREEMLGKFASYGVVKDFACRFRKKSGEVIFMLCTANFINIGGENCFLVSAFNITNHKKAEEALRLTEELFHKTFNVNPIAMAILSIDCNKILEVNEGFFKITGSSFTRGELELLLDIWVDVSERDKFINEIMQNGLVKNQEVRLYNKSGEIATVLLSGVFICWKNKECILIVANDITELRKYQNKIAWLDRMKLIGVTSAGIAHEIRNPLTTVKGFLQLFKERERYMEDREQMNLMIEELDRANAIITEFLSLAKNKTDNLKLQNLNASIMKFLPLLQVEAIKKYIYIVLELEETPDLMIDEDEIRQLILNLVHNGLDAMSAGSSLTIKTFMNSDGVTLSIEDQGKGISPEVIDKIGMPFFTTKDYGTGLGLPVCYSIAHRNNARIDIETSQEGTVFKVYFSLPGENSTYTKASVF